MSDCLIGEDMRCVACGKPAVSKLLRRNCSIDSHVPPPTPDDGDGMAADSFRRVRERISGPGTELSALLRRFGIEPTPNCQCRAKAAQMDAWGPNECERPERIEEVLAVMREEAKARGLPFLDAAGRMLIRRAIANARRAISKAPPSTE